MNSLSSILYFHHYNKQFHTRIAIGNEGRALGAVHIIHSNGHILNWTTNFKHLKSSLLRFHYTLRISLSENCGGKFKIEILVEGKDLGSRTTASVMFLSPSLRWIRMGKPLQLHVSCCVQSFWPFSISALLASSTVANSMYPMPLERLVFLSRIKRISLIYSVDLERAATHTLKSLKYLRILSSLTLGSMSQMKRVLKLRVFSSYGMIESAVDHTSGFSGCCSFGGSYGALLVHRIGLDHIPRWGSVVVISGTGRATTVSGTSWAVVVSSSRAARSSSGTVRSSGAVGLASGAVGASSLVVPMSSGAARAVSMSPGAARRGKAR